MGYFINKVNGKEVSIPPSIRRTIDQEMNRNPSPENCRRVAKLNKKYGQYATFGQLKRGIASFPIVSGAGDLGTVKLEINYRGGLSLKAGGTLVELTDYAITNLDGKPLLTGLVKANDSLVGPS